MFFTSLRVRYGSERRLHILYDDGAAPQSPKTDRRRIIRHNNIIIFYTPLFSIIAYHERLLLLLSPLVLILLIYAVIITAARAYLCIFPEPTSARPAQQPRSEIYNFKV